MARETITTDGTVTAILDFIYDESGRPFALNYSTNGGRSFTTYYYILNLQGDVVKLVRYIPGFEYEAVATYTYDAWGNILTATGDMAEINPLRYRGYYYDTETGFYYLQSRYYDPVNRRFINADVYASTGQGFVGTNMFAYCNNSPVGYSDDSGCYPTNSTALYSAHVLDTTVVAEIVPPPVYYNTLEEAVTAAATQANLLTQETDMEFSCGIYQMGGQYYHGKLFEGFHRSSDSSKIQAERDSRKAVLVAYLHSHPYCRCTRDTSEKFSNKKDKDGNYTGDYGAAYGSSELHYLATPLGQLRKLEWSESAGFQETTYYNIKLPVDTTMCECPLL